MNQTQLIDKEKLVKKLLDAAEKGKEEEALNELIDMITDSFPIGYSTMLKKQMEIMMRKKSSKGKGC